MQAHNVYFKLQDDSLPAVHALVDLCQKYLVDHPGIVSFAVGTLAEGLERDVNDRDFDVALQIIFAVRALAIVDVVTEDAQASRLSGTAHRAAIKCAQMSEEQ